MKIAMHQITSIRASFEEDLAAYAAAGWTAFEFSLDKAKQVIDAHGMTGFADRVKASGLSPIACTGHVVRAFGKPEEITANEGTFRSTMEIMAAIGCPTIVFGGDASNEGVSAPDQTEAGLAARDAAYRQRLAEFCERVARLADIATPYGITMALEMNWCGMCRSVRSAAEAVEMVDRPNVGLLFDTAHFACTPSRLSDLDRLDGKIVAGHLNDMRDCPPEIRNVNNDRVIPGEGVFPLVEWTDKVASLGFDGWYSVELFCEDLWREPVDAIARRVKDGCASVWGDARF
ncbi:MAG: sugar phosphate isomerase/epimerase [Candidatus Poribacteria bacterium]|nr:sugar phosphate isomerase/epimerase [Candidatus Poribacteria bacterium]